MSLSNPNVPPAVERATRVLRANRYLVLATIDGNGPWAAALAYVPVAPTSLYFFSWNWSRHSRALGTAPRVAGVIYDSRAVGAEVESIQFSGTCEEIPTAESSMKLVLKRFALRNSRPLPTDSDVTKHLQTRDERLYRLDVEEAFVLDQAAWLKSHVDAREPVDFRLVMRAVEEDYSAQS